MRGKANRWIEQPIEIFVEYGSLKPTSDIALRVKNYGKSPIVLTALANKEVLYLGEEAVFRVVRLVLAYPESSRPRAWTTRRTKTSRT